MGGITDLDYTIDGFPPPATTVYRYIFGGLWCLHSIWHNAGHLALTQIRVTSSVEIQTHASFTDRSNPIMKNLITLLFVLPELGRGLVDQS